MICYLLGISLECIDFFLGVGGYKDIRMSNFLFRILTDAIFPAQGKDSPRSKTLGLSGKRLSDPEAAKRRASRCTERGNPLHTLKFRDPVIFRNFIGNV